MRSECASDQTSTGWKLKLRKKNQEAISVPCKTTKVGLKAYRSRIQRPRRYQRALGCYSHPEALSAKVVRLAEAGVLDSAALGACDVVVVVVAAVVSVVVVSAVEVLVVDIVAFVAAAAAWRTCRASVEDGRFLVWRTSSNLH